MFLTICAKNYLKKITMIKVYILSPLGIHRKNIVIQTSPAHETKGEL